MVLLLAVNSLAAPRRASDEAIRSLIARYAAVVVGGAAAQNRRRRSGRTRQR